MSDSRNQIEQTNRCAHERVTPLTESEMLGTSGGDGRTLYEEWMAICAKYPDSAPCKGRH